MAEGGGIPEYKSGQVINPGESFILKPGEVYKPQIDKSPEDVVVQDKVSTREPQSLTQDEQIKAEQLAAARALLRDLPSNATLEDRRAAQQLVEEAIKNDTPAEKADPNARAAWEDAQKAKRPSNDSGPDWFGWARKLLRRTG